jgi:predicted ribosome quality control (RQC) complex YloA/Tae2 family protein
VVEPELFHSATIALVDEERRIVAAFRAVSPVAVVAHESMARQTFVSRGSL